MRYHGRYCGPWWSDGYTQRSVADGSPGIDQFDESCRRHDRSYSLEEDLDRADNTFVSENWGQGLKRSVAAAAVYTNKFTRAVDKYNPNIITKSMSTKKNLRGVATPKKNAKDAKAPPSGGAPGNLSVGFQMSRPTAPVTIGTMLRSGKPAVTRTASSARIRGSDFLATVEGQGVSTFGLGKSAMLSPAYFNSAILGNLARSFERYRFRTLRVHYVPKVSTAAAGQVILCSQRSVSEPGLQPESGTFLPRAMSQGNSVFSPLWVPTSIDIDCNGEWKLVDPATTTDPDDCIHEELQVYTQVATIGQVGYLIAEYDIEFKEPIYQPHSTSIPIFTGPGIRAVLVDAAAVNAPSDDWTLSDPTSALGLSSVPNGTVFRAVLDVQGSAAGTGANLNNLVLTTTRYSSTTSVISTQSTNYPLIGGSTIFLVVVGTVMETYLTLEAAVSGVGSGQLFYRTATTGLGSYSFDVALVRHAPIIIANIQ